MASDGSSVMWKSQISNSVTYSTSKISTEFGPMTVQQSPLRYDGVPQMPLEPSHALGADTAVVLQKYTQLDGATQRRLCAGM